MNCWRSSYDWILLKKSHIQQKTWLRARTKFLRRQQDNEKDVNETAYNITGLSSIQVSFFIVCVVIVSTSTNLSKFSILRLVKKVGRYENLFEIVFMITYQQSFSALYNIQRELLLILYTERKVQFYNLISFSLAPDSLEASVTRTYRDIATL